MLDEGKIFGRGINFPPRINANGRWAWSSGTENIRQSIQIILQTEPLERLMLPNFGSGLKKMVFQPNTVQTHSLIEELVTRALARWERRIKVSSVSVMADPKNDNTAWITLRYTLVANQAAENIQLRVQLNA
jgi:phage baseplate assembly protein W